jgi:Asp-tRNA(Asn)/Glu-tRNA(Gln) amidotransferase A subunit family amidase
LQDRIGNDNYAGLYLRAVGETAPYDSVMAIAQAFDEERANGTVRSGLHGIPMLFKVGALGLFVVEHLTD